MVLWSSLLLWDATLPVLRWSVVVSTLVLKKLAQQSGRYCAARCKSIHRTAGEDFNLGPNQLSHILFDVLKLQPMTSKRRVLVLRPPMRRFWETGAEEYQIVADVLGYRERARLNQLSRCATAQLVMISAFCCVLQTVAAAGDFQL